MLNSINNDARDKIIQVLPLTNNKEVASCARNGNISDAGQVTETDNMMTIEMKDDVTTNEDNLEEPVKNNIKSRTNKHNNEGIKDEQHHFHLRDNNLMNILNCPTVASNFGFDFAAIAKEHEKHLNDAFENMKRLRENFKNDISDFRVKTNSKEMVHRKNHDDGFKMIFSIIEKEQQNNYDNNCNMQQFNHKLSSPEKAICNSFDTKASFSLSQSNIPNCNQCLKGKDEAIEKIQHYLSEQNDIYLVTLKEQEQTLQAMAELTAKHFSTLQKVCRNETTKFEELWQESWTLLTDKHQKMIDSLHSVKENILKTSFYHMKGNMQKKKQEILRVYDEESEALKLIRLQLQEKVSKLEQEWSSTKCSSMIDADQLQYDHRELSSQNKEIENRIKKTKRCIIKLKEDLNREFGQSKLLEEKDKKKINALELDCHRLDNQFNNLLTKIQRFEDQEGQKFISARVMHNEEANGLYYKIRNVHFCTLGLLIQERGESDHDTLSFMNRNQECISSNAILSSSSLLSEVSCNWSYLLLVLDKYRDLLERRIQCDQNIRKIITVNHDLQAELDYKEMNDLRKALIISPIKLTK